MIEVAALYVDPRGPYVGRPDVDPWTEERDARLYDGPYPVVAHPPCGGWGRLRHLHKRTDKDCASRAVEQIRKFGGVLEHSAHSLLWHAAGLPYPCKDGQLSLFSDPAGGFSIEVEQCAWGHVARKATWLYFVGIQRKAVFSTIRRGGVPTHWIAGFHRSASRQRYVANGSPTPPGIKICSAQQRRRTPPAFAEWLIGLAKTARLSRSRSG